ncbi:peroxiredoxin [Paracoccaceae bacterium]|nr:peroxiredoxin [Paracoccaceae bacterium]
MRWLYRTTSQNFDVKETRLNDHMNQMGQDGWELLSVVPPQYGGKFVFFWKTLEATSSMDDLSKPDQDAMSKAQEKPQETRSKTIAGLKVETVQNGFDIGDKIPEFELQSTSGELYSTSNLSRNTILYFYPADGTEGCTIQAKGFSIVYETLADLGLDIVGVSPDTISAHDKFRLDENIPFHLLYDEGAALCGKLNLLKRPPPDEQYPLRVTFLIDHNRRILGKWNDIDVETHSDDVVSFVVDILEKAN